MKPINRQGREKILAAVGRVAVLLGGASSEREISLQSGGAVVDSLQKQGVDAVAVDGGADVASSGLEAVRQLQQLAPTMAVNMLHGKGGEDGVVQGLLQTLGIPCTGSGVLASALAMDKARSKLLWRQLGLPTPDSVVLDDSSVGASPDWPALLRQMGGAAVVKPVQGGSSIGITIVKDAAALQKSYREARQQDCRVMLERYIDGEEFTVGVLGGEALPAIQLSLGREFYDYEAKYEDSATRFICPPPLPTAQAEALQHLVLAAYHALGCRSLARVDVMQDGKGKFYLLEVNTIPGMTSHSLVPAAAKQAGLSFDDLVLLLLAEVLQRPQETT